MRDDTAHRSLLGQPRFLLAAGFVLTLAVLAAVLALTRGGGVHHKASGPAAGSRTGSVSGRAVATASHARASGGPNHCHLPVGSAAVPSSPPAADWTLEGSMPIPTRSGIGPEHHLDGLPVCYAHDPTGALFAAAAFWGAATAASPARVYRRLAADTPARARAIASARGDQSRLSDTGQVSLAGFTFASYSPQAASVAIVLQSTQGALVAVTCTMLWRAGDWHYEIPPGGSPPASQVDGLGGYVAWSASS
jgi:hypothetical protein